MMELACIEKMSVVNIALKDRNIFQDNRVINNLLRDEVLYMPKCDYFKKVQNDIQPFMRKVVTTWMLEVSILFIFLTTCWTGNMTIINKILVVLLLIDAYRHVPKNKS